MPSAYTRTGSAVVTLIPVNAGKIISINELPVVPWRASSRVMARLRGCAGGSSLLYGAGSFTVLGVGSFTVLGVDSVQPWNQMGRLRMGNWRELNMLPYFLGRRSVRIVFTAITMMQPLSSSHCAAKFCGGCAAYDLDLTLSLSY